jgi:Recombinase
MKQVNGQTSSPRQGRHGALANQRAADSRAHALASTIRKLMVAGSLSRRALAHELNRRRIPTARGGNWHYTTVVRLLTRLGLITKKPINNGLATKQAADARAKVLASTIRKLRKAGFVGIKAIARELNERRILTARGSKWYPNSTWRLLRRLEKLKHSSARCRPMSDAESRARPSGRHRR